MSLSRHRVLLSSVGFRPAVNRFTLRRGQCGRLFVQHVRSPGLFMGWNRCVAPHEWINDDERPSHEGMQLAVIGIASRRQRSEEEAAIRRDRDRLKGAGVICQTPVMADAMRRPRCINPANRGVGRHDGNPRLIVGRGRFERDLDWFSRSNAGRRCAGQEHA